ncbi:MAG TPA: DMT family transporter [Gemmatimonadales bacterium]|nr:DMT family transporter [Gemmatimonadales bacterium]
MIWFLLLAVLSGVVLPVQAGINTQLRGALGHPVLAAGVSFLIGTLALGGYIAAARLSIPEGAFGRTLWWHWTGGILGAFFVAVAVVLTPRLGAATLVATVVAGQMVASLFLDHYGLVGYAKHPMDLGRVVGALLVIAGVFLIQRPR